VTDQIIVTINCELTITTTIIEHIFETASRGGLGG